MVGIPKGKSPGIRPIGGFPGFLRLALKARRADIAQMDRSVTDQFFSVASGVSATDITWRLAASGEAAKNCHQHYGVVGWGLRSMYDLLEHKRLLARALALAVPFELCTVALAAYRGGFW